MFVRSKIFPFLNDSVETFHQWLFNKEEITKLAELNFEDMSIISNYSQEDGEDNFKYLTSNQEIPAYVRGLIKRAKTKKISLSDAMEEWFKENQMKFDNPNKEWPIVKKSWREYANDMRLKEKIKKFK